MLRLHPPVRMAPGSISARAALPMRIPVTMQTAHPDPRSLRRRADGALPQHRPTQAVLLQSQCHQSVTADMSGEFGSPPAGGPGGRHTGITASGVAVAEAAVHADCGSAARQMRNGMHGHRGGRCAGGCCGHADPCHWLICAWSGHGAGAVPGFFQRSASAARAADVNSDRWGKHCRSAQSLQEG